MTPLFVGRFHPLLVHFPIALLLAAGGLEAWVSWRERKGRPTLLRPATGPLLALAAASAVVAAAAGYLLGTSGGFAGEVYERHRWLGLSLAGSAVATAAAFFAGRRRPGRAARIVYLVLLGETLVLLVAAGHAGGTLTHGEGYLTRDAPAPVRALVDRFFPAAADGGGTARAAGRLHGARAADPAGPLRGVPRSGEGAGGAPPRRSRGHPQGRRARAGPPGRAGDGERDDAPHLAAGLASRRDAGGRRTAGDRGGGGPPALVDRPGSVLRREARRSRGGP